MATGYSGSINLGSDSYRGSIAIGSDELIDFSCTPCYDRQAIYVQAEYYCGVCDAFCCPLCKDFHNSFKTNKTHKMLGREDIDKWGHQDGGAQLPLENCPDHPGEILKLICLHDSVLCCSVCAALNHRTCPGMTYIPKIAKGVKDSIDLSVVDNTLDLFIKLVNEMIKSDEKAKISLDKSKIDNLQTIKNIRQQMDAFFSNLEKKASTDIDKFHSEIETGLQKHKKALNDTNDILTQHHHAIQPSSTNNESQLFIQMFKAQQILPELKHEIQKLADSPHTVSFHLDKDKKLHDIFTTIESLGNIKDHTTTIQRKLPNIKPLPLLEPKQQSPSPPQTPRRQQQSQPLYSTILAKTNLLTTKTTTATSGKQRIPQQNQLYTATNERDINVNMRSDTYACYINDSCQMPSGQILLTDFDNKKVKRLNTNYEPTDYVKLPASPWAICCIGDKETVVTCDIKTIHFLSITKRKMTLTRSTKLGHECYGIAYNKGHLFLSDINNKVYIYTTSGQCLKTIQQDKNGVDMFSEPRHICVSPDKGKVYVADGHKGLVTLDSEGNHLSTYSYEGLSGACSVCVDRQGRVLVCGGESQNVIQLEEAGISGLGQVMSHNVIQLDEGVVERVETVEGEITRRIGYPESTCIDNDNSTLIISMRFRDHIKVFDLE